MPFGVLDELDRLCLYDWCTGVHKHIVENLNKCKKKIMGAGIPQSVTLSGNVAVLQAWAVERLSLHGHPSHRFFPRIMRWFPFKSRTEKIENIFMTGDLNMEWYIRNEDRHRPEIRAAFNMDDGGMSEGSKVEKDDDEDESSDDGAWEAGAEERLRKNNEHIRALNAKIGVLTRELFEIYQTPIFHEADACGTDEEVGGGVDEGHGVGGEENADVGGEEEGDGNEVDDPLGADAEVRGDDNTVGNINFIEIDDDADEEEREVVPLAIPPLRSFVGDPSTSVDVNQLYTAVSIREMNVHRVVSEIIGQSLSTTSIYTLAPMKYVDNMHHILTDYRKRPQNRHVFTLHNYNTYLRSDHFGLEELPTADFLFLPFVHDDHWWCYSVKLRSMEIFVIDSLGKGSRDRKRIDTAVAENMARFFCILMNIPEGSIAPLTVKQANIPSQPNMLVSSTVLPDYIVMYMGKSNLMLWVYYFRHDCGVIMLKAMEIWDGDEKYNGKSMPEYTTVSWNCVFDNILVCPDACGTDEEVGGGVGGEENADVGGEEEGDGNEVDDPLGAHAEVRGDDETVRNINFIEIEDDGDEGEPEVVPLAIPPLRSFVGDPSTSVDVNQLYTAVSIREMNVHRVVSEIIGQSLSTTSIYTLAPMKYVDNMLFLPFVHDDHWWCYSVKLRSMEIFVIDSLGKGIRDRKRIDTAVAENMARLFCILMNTPEGSIGPLTVKQANIPSQPNLHDCGGIMLKAMEIWDGDEKYNGKSMPEYTTEELLGIRKKYVCE
ncbi:hypothetical protein LR48_Vigan97s001500 [Vigna angularis]|uniref:Ubiquitin-like protease family profile domain-containing protein n=1 Tax=Phaseolus angularis TaxID=3914 RepID=A0A0L9T3Z6_PHAAN|nr:hypothetical protein LR48_Vigan97s001500 [Vigna angularis]